MYYKKRSMHPQEISSNTMRKYIIPTRKIKQNTWQNRRCGSLVNKKLIERKRDQGRVVHNRRFSFSLFFFWRRHVFQLSLGLWRHHQMAHLQPMLTTGKFRPISSPCWLPANSGHLVVVSGSGESASTDQSPKPAAKPSREPYWDQSAAGGAGDHLKRTSKAT